MENKTANLDENMSENVESEINIQEIIIKYIAYWKWFLFSVLICLAIGVFFYMRSQREYSVSMSLLLKESTNSSAPSGSAIGSLQELGILSTTNNVDNEIVMLSSPNLVRQVVHALELQTSYYEKGQLRNTDVFKKCPYYVRLVNIAPDSLRGEIKMELKKSDNGIKIEGSYFGRNKEKGKDEEMELEGQLNKLPGFVDLPYGLGKLYVSYRGDTPVEDSKEYIVEIENAKNTYKRLVSEISIENPIKGSSALNIKVKTTNKDKGLDILWTLAKKYNEENVKENNQIASNTSSFVDDRIKEIGSDLGDIEQKIETYKKSQGIADLTSETRMYMEQSGNIEEKRVEIETQLNVINLVGDFIRNPQNKYKLIPGLGITDTGLNQIIMEYNSALIGYQMLAENTNENTPSRIRTEATLESMREQIINSVNNVKEAITITKNDIEKQRNLTSSRIHTIPMQERDLLELMRQQQINQTLYIFLLQTRIETNITMASAPEKAKIIADPDGPEVPISPKRNIILGASFLLGLILPIIGIYAKEHMKVHINNREELERLTDATILGEIPKNEEKTAIVVNADSTSSITELFRSLRNNVKFVLDEPDKKVILVTSTVPNEGKTFVSVNLATSFAFSTEKVLLIGMDLRNPELAQTIGLKKGRGVSEYLSGQESDWKNLVRTSGIHPNLSVLQAGSIPPNPNELLMKPSLKRMMAEAREAYDIIIIDSAPLGIISDTFLLKKIPDITLYVTRGGVTPKSAVAFINEVKNEKKMPNVYIVLNDVNTTGSKYGKYYYGHAYGYNSQAK